MVICRRLWSPCGLFAVAFAGLPWMFPTQTARAALVVLAMSQFWYEPSVVPVLPTIGTPSFGLPAAPVPDFMTVASA